MNAPIDMVEREHRTVDGFPKVSGPATRPRATIECQPGAGTGHITQDLRTDNSSNKALPWVVVALLAGAALALALDARYDRTEAIAAAILVAKAEMRAELESRVARAEALAELARKEASTAKDMVDLDRAKRKAVEELKHVR